MTNFKDLNIPARVPKMEGNKIDMHEILKQEIKVIKYEIGPSKFDGKDGRGNGKLLTMQIEYEGKNRVVFTGSGVLMDLCERIPKEAYPVTTTIVKEHKAYKFT